MKNTLEVGGRFGRRSDGEVLDWTTLRPSPFFLTNQRTNYELFEELVSSFAPRKQRCGAAFAERKATMRQLFLERAYNSSFRRCDMKKRSNATRREFLRGAAIAAATGVSASYLVPSSVLGASGRVGANDRVNIGVIGTGSRARMLMNQLPDPGKIVAICDCYHQRLVETMQQLKTDWPTYEDYRQMIDKENLDAVIVATPDHGRSLPCILAC